MELFDQLLPAVFRSRPNRFVLECALNGRNVRAYLPNPGRLWELLLPGARLLLARQPRTAAGALKYIAVAAERDGHPVMLHTHHTNAVARRLIEAGRIPGFEGAEVVRAEHRVGRSRFDFLLRKDHRDLLLEVKSCTLFRDSLAMFPDAVSARATKHLLELEELSRRCFGSAVLFIVHAPKARYFMPEHHTDLTFCRALLGVKNRVMVKAASVAWTRDLTLGDRVRELTIPWDLVERESQDRGSYLIVLRLPRDRRITVGGLGSLRFPKGSYVYVGSAMKDLTQRVARHRRLTKKMHWHIDHLRQHAEFVADIPIRSSSNRECEVAGALSMISTSQVPGFGCSDCRCASHLFVMPADPFSDRAFSRMLLDLRMGPLEQELAARGTQEQPVA